MSGVDVELFVRVAQSHDVMPLQQLERVARQVLTDQRGGQRRLDECPAWGDRWADAIDQADRGVVVGGVDGVVLAWLSVVGPDVHGVAVVDSVFVDEGARDLGLGDELVDWALTWSRRRGATSIESWALPGDRATKNLFERNGLTARLITVSRTLSDPASEVDASR